MQEVRSVTENWFVTSSENGRAENSPEAGRSMALTPSRAKAYG